MEVLFVILFIYFCFRCCLSKNKSAAAIVRLFLPVTGIMSAAETRNLICLMDELQLDAVLKSTRWRRSEPQWLVSL